MTYYTDDTVTLYHGDCIEVMRGMAEASVDAIVTDPPYGLEFMGKEWDAPWKDSRAKFRDSSEVDDDSAHRMSQARGTFPEAYVAGPSFQSWCTQWATEALRVLKPGGHLLAFGGTRTWHRLAVAIEDAGFEVRDSIAWMYGSGFPKSLDVSKAIDKAAGATRDRVPYTGGIASGSGNYGGGGEVHVGSKVDDAPATPEAKTWQGWGTALKPAFEPIVVARKPLIGTVAANVLAHGTGALNVDGCRIGTDGGTAGATAGPSDGIYGNGLNGTFSQPVDGLGRWPANVILDESQAENLGEESRFFYTAKASTVERPRIDGSAHPTVKPLTLMRYLVRLVTPPGGIVLEPFAGSGTTLEACIVEGFKCIGIERDPTYLELIVQRVSKPIQVTLL
jgi:site-specific DNA-methyltransferase (adenine-specific)